MKTASTILGIIGGLLGIVTGYLTQTVGGINSFLRLIMQIQQLLLAK